MTLDEDGRIVRTAEHDARSALLGLRFEAWLGEQAFDAGQARWAGLIGSRIRADATTIDGFWDYDLDSHPFAGLGGYDQAARVFGGRDALDLVLGTPQRRGLRQERAGRRPGADRRPASGDGGLTRPVPLTPELRCGIDRVARLFAAVQPPATSASP